MHSEGIEVQPINTLDSTPIGHHEVNTVFFEDVKVPKENLVGEEGKDGLTQNIYLSLKEGMVTPLSFISNFNN
jgi:hypothetical protein